MITINQITEGAKFRTKSGIIWIIDAVTNNEFGLRNGDELVRTSMEHGKKGNYRDSINEVVLFLNEQEAVIIESAHQ